MHNAVCSLDGSNVSCLEANTVIVSVLAVPEESPTKVTISAVVHPQPRDRKTLREEHIGIIIGALAALILLLFAIAVFILLRHQNKKKSDSKSYPAFEKHRMTGELEDFKSSGSTNGPLTGYHMYNVVATSDADFEESTSFQKLKLNELYRDAQESQLYEQRKGRPLAMIEYSMIYFFKFPPVHRSDAPYNEQIDH